ncbi:MAG: ATP-binding protein [Verrucomicrobia bacterium]|nr:ATP-binding protein [Verrucomicrobiota bacterium]
MEPRYLAGTLREDALARGKTAFVSGPRQVGKTTLAKSVLETPGNYYVFDDETFRRAWIRSAAGPIEGRGPGPVVLDEIHKDRRWKSKLKGLYDAAPSPVPLIVTGSARLDLARRGADSLLGRYLPYRLHGFTTGEGAHPPAPDAWQPGGDPRFPWEDLLRLGGFPEPLLGGAEGQALRWSRLRLERIALEDSRDLMNISDPQALMNLLELLPSRIGSLLSVRSLHEDVGKAYATGHDSPPPGPYA